MVDFEIQKRNMMSVLERRAAVARADGIYGRDTYLEPRGVPCYMLIEEPFEVLSVLATCRKFLGR